MLSDPQKILAYWCNKAAQAFRSQLDKEASLIGLKSAEAFVLLILYGKLEITGESSSLVEIAKHLEHTHPSVLRQIDSLEEAGYVERSIHPDDRRVKIISLTDKGRMTASEVMKISQAIHARATKGFSEDRIAAAVAVLRDIITNLDRADLLLPCDENQQKENTSNSSYETKAND
ncbi:MarR family transcriptional regulator [bacterium]|nr:MarR family winged helix-turn-helix transcriptional regulator [bacterium]RQV95495.1 MAG: MarR family transcriptional regulator [bacterium]